MGILHPDTDDQGRVLLEPIVYEPVLDEHGHRVGWRVPDSERPTWDALAEQHEKQLGVYARAPQTKKISAKPLDELLDLLRPWVVDFNYGLEQDVGVAYRADADRTTRMVVSIVQGCEAQRIHSPGGMLRSRLADMRQEQQ